MAITSQARRIPTRGSPLDWPRAVLPIEDAARKFGVHPTTIYRYVRLGYLKKFKRRLDRRTYIDSKALEELRKRAEFEERK